MKSGDLWWSPITGCLSIYYIDSLLIYEPTSERTEQWVITDPAGIRPLAPGGAAEDYAGDTFFPDNYTPVVGAGFGVESQIKCQISAQAPTTQADGTPLEFGNLFWSYLTGKMYVYWEDSDGNVQWTVTNPSGSFSSNYAADVFPDGPIGPVVPTPTHGDRKSVV